MELQPFFVFRDTEGMVAEQDEVPLTRWNPDRYLATEFILKRKRPRFFTGARLINI